MYTGPPDEPPDGRDPEREHADRVEHRNRISWTILSLVMAAALALLSYDSGGAALDAHRAGRPWLYPAAVSAGCLVLLLSLGWRAGRALRRRRGRVSHRGPA